MLSSNDGNVIARSDEVKAAGIKMGQPFFEIRDIVRQHNFAVFSSNFTLYGDMSNRFMDILRQFSPIFLPYSIDEGFLLCDGMNLLYKDPSALGHAIRDRVNKWTGLPVCVGFGSTPTLAKFANHVAKKDKSQKGVFDLTSIDQGDFNDLLNSYDVEDTWGVGQQIGFRLKNMGVMTMADLRRAPLKWLRSHFGVVMERTGMELRGTACIELEDVPPPRKQLVCSRTFGDAIKDIDTVSAAVASFTATAAEKLRKQGSVCGAIQVFISTSRFSRPDLQYSNSRNIVFSTPTNDTVRLTAAALYALEAIFAANFDYRKAGVALLDISPSHGMQGNLFENTPALEKSQKLMAVCDTLNARYGRKTISLAATHSGGAWHAKAAYKSAAYTTRWSELMVAKAD